MSIENLLEFQWDETKARSNYRKHGITFDEAKSAFQDGDARFRTSIDHRDDEYRFVLMGISLKSRLIVVTHTYRDDDRIIRIISARKANHKERFQYRSFKL